MSLPRSVMEAKQCGAMGKSLPGGDIQVLNSYRISATVTGKEGAINCAPCTSPPTQFLRA